MAVMKLRPVLLLPAPIGDVPEILVAYISSVIPARILDSDIIIDPKWPEYATKRLKVVSVLRLHKLATIHTTSLQRYIGVISTTTLQVLAAKLQSLLSI